MVMAPSRAVDLSTVPRKQGDPGGESPMPPVWISGESNVGLVLPTEHADPDKVSPESVLEWQTTPDRVRLRSMSPETRRFAERVRAHRIAVYWSLRDLGQHAHLHPNHIAKIERQEVDPSLTVAGKIARAFKVRLGELLDP